MENITDNTSCCTDITFEKIPIAVELLIRINGFIIILLNGFVLSCLLCYRKRFRESLLWTQLISLSLTDTFAGVCIFIVSHVDARPFSTSRVACRLVLVIAITSQVTTLCNIFAIGVHRMWILTKLQLVGRRVGYIPFVVQLSLIILLGAIFTVTAILGWPVEGQSDAILGCEFTTAYAEHKSKATMFIACSVFIPLFSTNVLYVSTFIMLKRSVRLVAPAKHNSTSVGVMNNGCIEISTSQHQTQDLLEKRKLDRERNAFLLIAIILITIDLFTLPTIVMQINTAFFGQESQISRTLKLSIASSITFNSLINPFVYVIRLSEFRQIVRGGFLYAWKLIPQSH